MTKITNTLPSFGALERLTPEAIRGWAVWQGAPADLTVHVSGDLVAHLVCDQERPELAGNGLPLVCGFTYRFAQKLRPEEAVEVRLPDGNALPVRTGMIDRCAAGQVAGWAVDGPAGAWIEIKVNGALAARTACARPRPDLEKRGLPVKSGFVHVFAPALTPGDQVSVCFADGAPLRGSPRAIEVPREGSLDRCTTTRLGGWAAQGDADITLEVFINGVLTARVACDRERPDLAKRGVKVRSGFLWSPVSPLALTDHVSVRFADGVELKNSPRQPGHQQDGSLDMCSTARVVGWAAQDGQPAELDLFVGGARVKRFRCDGSRPDLLARGVPEGSGFAVLLAQGAAEGEEVAVCFTDGTHLAGSPKRPSADYGAAAVAPVRIGDSAPGLDAATVASARALVLFAGLAVKEALIARDAVEDAFAQFVELVAPPACTALARKPLLGLGVAPKKSRAAWYVIDAGGAAFEVPAPVVIGDGNHWKLSGVSRPSFLACLKNARVRGRSAVIELADAALLDFQGDELTRLDDRLAFDPAVFHHEGAYVDLLQPPPLAPEVSLPAAFSLLGAHTDAFGHWMWEYLPKYLAAVSTGALAEVPVLVDAVQPNGVMPAAHLALLRCLLPAGVEIIEVRPFTTVKVERLWCAAAQMHMPLLERMNGKFRWDYLASPPARLAGLMRQMAARVPVLADPAGAPERVYLARRDSHHRRLTNRLVIEAIALARGFRIIYPETLDIFAQAHLLRGARYVLGPEGSAFFLGFFAQPGSKMCILDHPHTAGLPLLTGPLAAMGVQSTVFTGPFAAVQAEWRHCSDYSLDEVAFAQFLDRWLEGAP